MVGDGSRRDYRALNAAVCYTMWSVWRVGPGRLGPARRHAAEEAAAFVAAADSTGVTVRGVYELSGLRADADYMIWWHADRIETLQAAYSDWRRRTALGRASAPVWSQVALHRPAEFNKSHVPAFLAGEAPRRFLCVYPFVRTCDWYLLPEADRRGLLAEHGRMARGFPDVRANTVAAFALGDYEGILAFEADQAHRLLELIAHLRGSQTRRYVRREIPFYTGRRVELSALLSTLP
jgi:chlorite dismutase